MTDLKAVLRRSWTSHFWTNVATTGVLTLSFAIILGMILVNQNLKQILSAWGDAIQISIYLKDDVSSEGVEKLRSELKNIGAAESLSFVSKEAAYKAFEQSLSSYGPKFLDAIKMDQDNPFPASFILRLKKDKNNPVEIEKLAENILQMSGVEDVNYGQEWIRNYSTLVNVSRVLVFLLTGVLVFGCVFAVSNSIQSSLASRREEIEILELVGATSKTIRVPFLMEGAFQGFLAILFSAMILAFVYVWCIHLLEHIMGAASVIQAVSFLPWPLLVTCGFLGTGLGALGSYICVVRMNSGWAAAQHIRN